MTDLTFNWKFYVHNVLYGNWTEGEDSGKATYIGDLKGDVDSITLTAGFRANVGSPLGTKAVITYAFVAGTPTEDSINRSEFIQHYGDYIEEAMTPELRAAAQGVFEEVSGFANVTFVEAKEGEVANINIFQMSSGGGEASPLTGPDNATYLIIGIGPSLSDRVGGLTSDFALDTWTSTFRHELGHTLGLAHPISYEQDPNWPASPYDPSSNEIPPGQATGQFTVMSYTSHELFNDQYGNYTFAQKYGVEGDYTDETYGLIDIKALQFLYGVNEAATSGNDTYSFRAENASVVTIYDAGGIDTFDLSNQTHGTITNLEQAGFSSVGLVHTDPVKEVLFLNNIGIAWDTVIENVIGSEHKDIINGNGANNKLEGRGGDDRIKGGAGNDVLIGGEGVDRINGGTGDDAIWAGPGDTSGDVFGGADGNDTIGGGAGDDYIWGDVPGGTEYDGDDMLYGGTGNDYLIGGGGDDTIYGGAGADVIEPGWGFDVMTGGAGADTFIIDAYTYNNVITDFDVAEDLLDLSSFSIETLSDLATSVTQDGKEGVLLTLDDTADVFLIGLSLSDITNNIAGL